ncbi:MAG: DUF4956 domain-containing protein [Ignavibacteriae bacterium]|nr:DUF4956 domain-containing protein [Ignavibacteriota bacterium]
MDTSNFFSFHIMNGDFYLHFFIRFVINLIVIFVITRLIYFHFRRKREYLFTFFVLNILVFLVCFLLQSSELSIGFAFGIFAIFSILRYRTITVPIKEMTYVFISIAIALINSLISSHNTYLFMGLINFLIIVGIFVLEKVFVKNESQKDIIYEKIDLIKPVNHKLLIEDLKERTGLNIHRFDIVRIDFLRDIARLRVYYFDKFHTDDQDMYR